MVYRAPVRRSQLRFFRLGYEIKPFSVWQSANDRPNDGLWCVFRRFCEIETCPTPSRQPDTLRLVTRVLGLPLDEDTSINAAPRELQEEYELAQVSGDKERIEEVLTILWEDYGIHGKTLPPGKRPELSVLQS